MIHLTINEHSSVLKAPLFDLDYWTLRYQGKLSWPEICEWDVNERRWKSLCQVGPFTEDLRLASEAKLQLTFVDARRRDVHVEEDYSITFEPTSNGSLVIVGGSGDTLAKMARGTGEWEVATRNGLWCPRIAIAPIGVALDSLCLEPAVRGRLSGLAERVFA